MVGVYIAILEALGIAPGGLTKLLKLWFCCRLV